MDDILILCLLFWQNSFYQNCFIQIFFYSNISVEYKMDDKLGFDIDNIMKKFQFAGTRRTQVVSALLRITYILWSCLICWTNSKVVQNNPAINKVCFPCHKSACQYFKSEQYFNLNINTLSNKFQPIFYFCDFRTHTLKNCSSQPSMVHGWEALSFLVRLVGWLFVRSFVPLWWHSSKSHF